MSMTTSPQNKKSIFIRLLPLGGVVIAISIFLLTDTQQYLSLEALRDHQDILKSFIQDNLLLSVVLFMIFYALGVAISVPGASVLSIFGGVLFGFWAGTAYVVVAATFGALGVFFVARSTFAQFVQSKMDGFVKKLERGFRRDELSYMFVLRLMPVVPFWVTNIAAGVLGVKVHNYLLGTFFGIIPGTAVYVSIGSGISTTLATDGAPDMAGILLQPTIFLPLLGLCLLSIIPIIYKKAQSRSSKRTD